jgi:hypothetical protein
MYRNLQQRVIRDVMQIQQELGVQIHPLDIAER